jgi:serine phosphatase RsbU (regulator of sigma subunit)
VSGDFYWFSQKDDITFIAAADCTGHGVPGAFMSMIANSFLNEVVNERNILQPDQILNTLREKIIKALRQTGESMENKDGLDISFCSVQGNRLSYSGANNPIWIVRNMESASEFDDKDPQVFGKYKLVEIPPDKQPIGTQPNPKPFSLKTLQLLKGDTVYLFTDGFADQFGGPKKKKFKYRNFSELLLSIHESSMEEQKNALNLAIEKWMGDLEQIDDILVIGFRY